MPTVMTAAALHKQYAEGVSAFCRQIANPPMRVMCDAQVDAFFRSCALGVWQAGGDKITTTHVEYYNAIYHRGADTPSVLFWELGSAVADYSGFTPPVFFQKMREYDRAYGKETARQFIDLATLMLLLFAAADGAVSDREAGFVNSCADTLSALCDADGLPGGKDKVNADDFVTRQAGQTAGGGAQTAQVKEEDREEKEPAPSLEELMAELDSLCGLEKVKADVKSLINLVKVRKLRQEADLPVPPMSLHLVFMGNPGTGKTTVARLLSKIYHAIGVLSKGQLVEVDRSGLVAGFVGQTAIKTNEVIQKALGGVLFIDEAYALANQDNPNDFGQEAIEALLKGMEDHRADLIVIVAGYTELMDDFIHANPGLESRFNKYFYFEDYTGTELMEIFRSMCKKNGYQVDGEGETYAAELLQRLYDARDENFGNARDVRNLFERAISRQSDRIAALEAPTKEDLMTLTAADLKAAAGEETAAPDGEAASPAGTD